MNMNLQNAIDKYKQIEDDFIKNIESKYKLVFDKNGIFTKGFSNKFTNEFSYINFQSSACKACRTGVDTHSVYLSLKCNKNCYFCFNPNQDNFEKDIKRKFAAKQIANKILKNNQNIKFIALTGGEPLLYKDDALEFFKIINESNTTIHKRLYTNGTLIDTKYLKKLKSSGLDEIRFSIKLEDSLNEQADIIEKIEDAKHYIKTVMVEMPVIPKTLEKMKNIMFYLEQIGIDGINLLEFCFPFTNEKEYIKRGFMLKYPPFQTYYNYWYAGGLAISGSEEESLELLKFASENKFKMGVFYCSLANKHLGQIYQQNTLYPKEKWQYFSQNDYFLKTAKVFDEDIFKATEILKQNGIFEYYHNQDLGFLEFHPKYINLFKDKYIDIGLSSNVIEVKNDEVYLRELKIQKVKINDFNLKNI